MAARRSSGVTLSFGAVEGWAGKRDSRLTSFFTTEVSPVQMLPAFPPGPARANLNRSQTEALINFCAFRSAPAFRGLSCQFETAYWVLDKGHGIPTREAAANAFARWGSQGLCPKAQVQMRGLRDLYGNSSEGVFSSISKRDATTGHTASADARGSVKWKAAHGRQR
jgi:hypothetical protein